MAAAKRGPLPLAESALAGEVASRVGGGFSKSDVSKVIKALKEEITECLQLGHKVTLSGLMVLTPIAKPGRKKGTVVYNPFDKTSKTLRADEQPSFRVRAAVSKGVKDGFPSAKTQTGAALVKQLTPVVKAKKKAEAPAAAKGKGKK